MGKITLYSYAKLNLYLSVINRRKDNFHNIKTLFEKIGLSDKIILTSRRDKEIKIICANSLVPKDNTNLAYRSARLLQDTFGIKKGLSIRIIKRIPVGAGLGGGSSNAAAVLTGLNRFWGLHLTTDKLAKLAANLGSDVPFFVYDTPFALGSGRGERVKPLKTLNRAKLWHVLVVPKLVVSTPLIYKSYDKHIKSVKLSKKVGLTIPEYNVKILTLALRKKDISLTGRAMFNSLEAVTCGLYPQVVRVKNKLIRLGLKAILMSGSGPAVFGIVSSRKEAVSFCVQLKAEFPQWQVFVCGTV